MSLEYGFGGSFDAVASWTSLGTEFNFTSLKTGTGALDGNLSSNRKAIYGLQEGLDWAADSTLWIRWIENNDSGNDHGLAIDDVFIASNTSLTVDTLVDEDDGDYSVGDLSLREAIAIAHPGFSIDFDPALTSGGPATIVLTQGELLIDKNLIIEGPGADLLTIDASGNDPTPELDNSDGSRVFNINDHDYQSYLSVSLSGMTITGADANNAIYSFEDLSLSSVKVIGNHGGVSSIGDLAIVDSELSGNSSSAIVSARYRLDMSNTTISNNTGTAVQAKTYFGGVFNITDSTISGNTATKGGGIYVSRYYEDAIVTITNTVISGNTATQGSAIYSYGGDITLIDSTVSGNLGADAAIRIRASDATHVLYGGDLTLNNTDVVNNEGAGVSNFAAGDLYVVDSEVSGNSGIGLSFAVDYFNGAPASSAMIINSKFNDNAAGLSVQNYSTATIEGCEISNNTSGGGLFIGGFTPAEISDSVIADNQLSSNSYSHFAGGISSYDSLTITNSTISGNSTTTANGHGGIYALISATLSNSTVTGNSSSGAQVGGVETDGPLTLENSIVAGNTTSGSNPDVGTSSITANFSLIGDTSGLTPAQLASINAGAGNLLDVDPLLGPLQDNGGPTFTHAAAHGEPGHRHGRSWVYITAGL